MTKLGCSQSIVSLVSQKSTSMTLNKIVGENVLLKQTQVDAFGVTELLDALF